MPHAPIYLASTSPYRRELLQRLHLPFTVVSPSVDEKQMPDESPQAMALRLAEAKARAVAVLYANALVIGSDQVADLSGTALGKPLTHANAVQQLRAMSAQRVVFHTALCVVDAASGRAALENIQTVVKLRKLSDQEIENYLLQDKPYDCAGSAKVESLGIALADSITSSDPTALIGLPLITLARLLREAGADPLLYCTQNKQ